MIPRARVLEDASSVHNFIDEIRRSGRTLGLTSGVFDLLHVGHLGFLQRARALVDALLVGVDSDDKVTARKGEGRPILPQQERIEMLTHVRHVDAVVVKEAWQPKWSTVRLVKPDILIVSHETYGPDDLDQLSSLCGRVEVIRSGRATSTSQGHRIDGWRQMPRPT